MAVNQERVNSVCDELAKEGKKPTLAAVRDSLGEGSFSTLAKMVRDWKAGRGDVAGVDVVAVSVPDVVATAGGKLLAEVWALAEKAAGERLAAERADMEAAKGEMGVELEAAYAEMEALREQLAQARAEVVAVADRERAGVAALDGMRAEVQALRVDVAAARAEAGAFRLAIEKINPQEKKPANKISRAQPKEHQPR